MSTSLPITTNFFKLSALRDYCCTQFRDINLILREGIKDKKDFDRKYQEIFGEGETSVKMFNDFMLNIDLLDELFEDQKTNEQIVVYRKFRRTTYPKLEKGDVYIDKGFVSTSLNYLSLDNVRHSDVLTYDTVSTIYVSPGTPCVYIGEEFGRNESELLLGRNLKFKVLSNKADQLELKTII